jgi:hypothetical protein
MHRFLSPLRPSPRSGSRPAARTAVALALAALAAWLAGGLWPVGASARTQPPLVPPAAASLVRAEVHLAAAARTSPHLLLMTVGGPIYCVQLATLARDLDASRLCTDYGPNRYTSVGTRALRRMDWGDPNYLDVVAKLPARLRQQGVRISGLVLVGVSYSGYDNAELVATHPELRPLALVVIDSFLDLPERYLALRPSHETRAEIESVIGASYAQDPVAYEQRSPSHHLAGLAQAIRDGMRFVDVWSVGAVEKREFNGATCSYAANAQWLSALAGILDRPVTGYVTHMRHGHALWDDRRSVLELAGIGTARKPLPAMAAVFQPGQPAPPGASC